MKKILVRGPALAMAGYGVQTRYALNALKQFPDRFDVYLINTPWGNTGWIWEESADRVWIDSLIQKTIQYQQSGGQYDISLQVTIPSEWQQMAPINIGYTAGIETTKMSPKWLEGCFKVNKIITTSTHARYALDNTSYPMMNNQTGQQIVVSNETPIEVVQYPVKLHSPKEIQLDLKHDFNFLVVAQWGPRKNIENTVKFFLSEFWNKNVGLVLKLQSVSNCLMDREFTQTKLKQLVEQLSNGKTDRKCSIQLLHGDLSDEEMTFIYNHPKIRALISISHGEGFGLPIFEAIYNGLPVIAPAWGGQTDFIYVPQKDKNKIRDICMIANTSFDIGNVQKEALVPDMIIPDSQWCFPKEWHVKQQMREIHKNYGTWKNKALKLQTHIKEKFEAQKMYKKFADAVSDDVPTVNILDFLNEKPANENLEEVVNYD